MTERQSPAKYGLSGPMFEQDSNTWKSAFGKDGAHYNIYESPDHRRPVGVDALRKLFPDGEANDLNFVLFSTSGVHGSYMTIEEVEAFVLRGEGADEDGHGPDEVTFLIVHPRIVCMRYGNCGPKTSDDFEFLKKLRASSWAAIQSIGKEDEQA